MAKDGTKGGKASKSNKTAHVLNLLTTPAAKEPAGDGGAPLGAAAAFPPIQKTDDAEVSAQIRSALEQELAAEEAGEPVPAEETPEAALEAAPDTAAEASPQTAPPEKTPLPAALTLPGGISCINVMQTIVEEKVDKYINLFGLCSCPRCRIDVMALTLTSLPAKYVVVKEQEMIPMLSVYEGRFNASVVAQVMSACKKVMEHPRHEV